MHKASLPLPIVLIVVGALWLLKTTHILLTTAILLAAVLVVAGLCVLLINGISLVAVRGLCHLRQNARLQATRRRQHWV